LFPALPLTRITGARRTPRAFPGTRAGALMAGTAVVMTSGCGMFAPSAEVASDINVTSPLIQEGRPLPAAYTCEAGSDAAAEEGGEGLDADEDAAPAEGEEEGEETAEGSSPPLNWSGLPDPDDVGSIAVVVDDPQAPEVFWVLFDVDPQLGGLRHDTVPPGARQAQNSVGEAGYQPPCPEEGDPHEYRFTVYALRDTLDLPDGSELSQTLEAIADNAIARGALTTTSE
jgi:Raf kinase inhibitor-like YbhB/YbcL family protein